MFSYWFKDYIEDISFAFYRKYKYPHNLLFLITIFNLILVSYMYFTFSLTNSLEFKNAFNFFDLFISNFSLVDSNSLFH